VSATKVKTENIDTVQNPWLSTAKRIRRRSREKRNIFLQKRVPCLNRERKEARRLSDGVANAMRQVL